MFLLTKKIRYNGGYNRIKDVYGPDTAGMVDMAHKEMKNPDYIKDTIELKNFDDPRAASG